MPISFAAPWALGALILLPALWWLLRLVPPAPRRQDFPALRLLLGLATRQRTARRTPPWLVALRLLLGALVIVAAAHPLRDAGAPGIDGPFLLVVDNGWAAAAGWAERRAALDGLLDRAEREGRPVALLATAPAADGSGVSVSALMPAGRARALAGALRPQPWAVDRRAALAALSGVPPRPSYQTVWLSDGLEDDGAAALGMALRRLGGLDLILPTASGGPLLLMPPSSAALAPELDLRRLADGAGRTVAVLAIDGGGRVLARAETRFAPDAARATARFDLPLEQRNRVARFLVEGVESAGAVALLDDRFGRHPVGLADRGSDGASPLLDDLYYAERALAPMAELRKGPVAALAGRDLSLIVLPDGGALSAGEQARLKTWIEAGGVLVRLAGPKLARNPDPLLPVTLLGGGRTLGGAMSWTHPMTVAPIGDSGPFAGLAVPDDVSVRAQVLAAPAVDLADRTWARLSDGTPLVTGRAMGKGWLVLIHTTIRPEWSDLGLSGLFPAMLERLLALSQGQAPTAGDAPLAPMAVMDGFGHLAAAGGITEALAPRGTTVPGPRHPPGYYGTDAARVAFNLAPAVGDLAPLVPPGDARLATYDALQAAHDLRPPVLVAALILLLVDLAAAAALKGAFARRALPLVLLLAGAVAGAVPATARAANAEQAALHARLAYVVTGDAAADSVSRAGLEGLSDILARRTTVQLAEPDGVDLGHDALMVYPLLYWPVTAIQPALDGPSRERVNDFLRHGGMILFDTRDRGDGGPEPLRRLTEGLDIPALAPVTDQHVLAHAFYLLHDFPGRFGGGAVYAEDGGDPANDNVSPVVIGGNDWAAAWAVDDRGRPLFAAVPGGERQRELAYRFGVNLVMYALTGSYKADQVHLPAILDRMRR